MEERTINLYIRKRKAWKTLPMHNEVFEALSVVGSKTGRVFPGWKHRQSVYHWLTPLRRRLGVRFTPHMARHKFVSDLNEAGATDQDIMHAGSWLSTTTIPDYTDVHLEHARDVINRTRKA